LRFRVYGLGSVVEVLGFRVQGLVWKVEGLTVRVYGEGFIIRVSGLKFHSSWFRVSGLWLRYLCFRVSCFRIEGVGFEMRGPEARA
jgi:hypothetical protein